MASKLPVAILRGLGRSSLRPSVSLRVFRAAYSTDASPPPLLAKLKEDLKAAMRAKDTNRLNVLRSVLTATLNASKTDKPITTDAQLVSLLLKTARKSQEAAAEARAAGREDIAEKEEAQQRILGEYAASSGLRELGESELRQIVERTKASLVAAGVQEKALMGQIVRGLLAPGGPLDGTSVSKQKVTAIIKEVLNTS
ncbi:Yqey-like protein-domain-containing protein [Achaetomium macrosporum]|uniref:Altered inheritance of mitochondria protein 41 n=1 Tax=Achaetomium macrosporum TaxID=79813 RepID=A0AAN7CBN8_9PEZI|nr:Yqey-like protein-domain-containing protein [Achaetomium macrosporum]